MTGRKDIVLPYTKLTLDNREEVYFPLIPIELQKGRGRDMKSTNTFALIDSGSMYNIFPSEIAIELGIDDLESGEYMEIGGIASDDANNGSKMIRAWRHTVIIGVKGRTRDTEAYFSPDLSKNAFSMLGQTGFFDKFRAIKMEYRKSKITIIP